MACENLVFNELSGLSIFAGFTSDELRGLLAGARVRTHYSGEHLFRESESAGFFGYVLSGAYKLSLTDSDGNEVIMHFGVRGEALGIMATMQHETTFPYDAIAMGPSSFLEIPRRTFFSRWICSPTVMLRYQSSLQGRLFRSLDEKRLQRRPLTERIADLLVYLSEHKTARCGSIEIPITRREVAGYVGATVESVIRVMSTWSHAHIIETSDRKITIRCRDALHKLAGEEQVANGKVCVVDDGLAGLWKRTEVSARTSQICRNPDCPSRRSTTSPAPARIPHIRVLRASSG